MPGGQPGGLPNEKLVGELSTRINERQHQLALLAIRIMITVESDTGRRGQFRLDPVAVQHQPVVSRPYHLVIVAEGRIKIA